MICSRFYVEITTSMIVSHKENLKGWCWRDDVGLC